MSETEQSSTLNKRVTIYALSDPRRSYFIRYIGKTILPLKKRLRQHISNQKRKTTPKNSWIYSLLKTGVNPIIWPIEYCGSDKWIKREKYWIYFFKPMGILNVTEGGDSGPDMTGYKHSDESRKKIALAGTGRKIVVTESFREKARARGKLKVKEFLLNVGMKGAEANRGRKNPAVSLRLKGIKRTNDDIAKIRIGILNSPKFITWKNTTCKKVLCKTTGKIFDNVSCAERELGITRGTLQNAIKRGTKCRKMEWIKL